MHPNNQPRSNCIIGANLGVTNFNFIVDDCRLNIAQYLLMNQHNSKVGKI